MRVIILHYAAPPIKGGVERVIFHHALELVNAGHEVCVIAGRGAPFHEKVEFKQVDLVDSRHPAIDELKTILNTGHVPSNFEAVTDTIYKQLKALSRGYDAIIAHNVLSLHMNMALTAAMHRLVDDVPHVIAWHHDLAWLAERYAEQVYPDRYPWTLLTKRLPRVQYVTVSELRKRELAQTFIEQGTMTAAEADSIQVVSGGVDVTGFLKLEPEIEQFYEQHLTSADPILLLPARILGRKNIELGIEIMNHLRRRLPNAKLVITGPPDPHNPGNMHYFDKLKQLRSLYGLQDAVYFLYETLGHSPTDQGMVGLYHLADALLYPSKEEGFGLPILEAALTQLPIFCARIPALVELAGDYAHFFSIDSHPADIADRMALVLSSQARVRQLRRKVLNHYDWKRVVQDRIIPMLERDNARTI